MTAAKDPVIRTTTSREKVYENNFAFSLGIRYLQVVFTTSKDSKNSHFKILYEESAEC